MLFWLPSPHKNVNAVVVFAGLNDYHHRCLILVKKEDSRCKASLGPTILVTNVCFLCSFSLSAVHNLFISRPSVYLEAFSRWTHSPFYARLFTEIIRHNTQHRLDSGTNNLPGTNHQMLKTISFMLHRLQKVYPQKIVEMLLRSRISKW